MSGNKTDVKQSVKITECMMLSELLTVNWQQTAKITEVANPLGSKRCQKYRVAKGPIIGRERTTREKSRSRKVHKSFRVNELPKENRIRIRMVGFGSMALLLLGNGK